MKPNLREWIQEAAGECGVAVDADLENFIFYVASAWGNLRVDVAEQVRNGTYDPK